MPKNTPLITLITHAIKLSQASIGLGLLAILCFLIFGTLASLERFRDNTPLYLAFYYLPYILIGLSIPISLYHVFLLYRYRLIQTGILIMVMLLALVLSVLVPFMGAVAWFAMPFLFKTNLNRFLNFLKKSNN